MNLTRGVSAAPLHLAAGSDDGTFEGYLCIYGAATNDSRRLKVSQGAFKAAVANPENVRLLYQHDDEEPVGVWTKLEERNRGLYGYGKLVLEVQKAREAYALMQAKALDGISMGWRATKIIAPSHDKPNDGFTTVEGELLEASIVTFPAFNDARVLKASIQVGDGETKEVELTAREASFVDMAYSSFSVLSRGPLTAQQEPELRKYQQALRDLGLTTTNEAERIGNLVKADARWVRLVAERRDDAEEAAKLAHAAEQQKSKLAAILKNLQL